MGMTFTFSLFNDILTKSFDFLIMHSCVLDLLTFDHVSCVSYMVSLKSFLFFIQMIHLFGFQSVAQIFNVPF